jgi:hypothetical protein
MSAPNRGRPDSIRTHSATSSGRPNRRAGISLVISGSTSVVMSVSINPGTTAFTVIPFRATSAAADRVKAMRPPLAAA